MTPSGARVIAHKPDGTEVDVTDGVMAMYDLVIGSMNWTSGFWSVEDAAPVAEVARACGFAQVEEVDRYLDAQRHSEEQARFLRERRLTAGNTFAGHEHVWSTVGYCMWPGCYEYSGH